jgi:hypothetical protein
LILLTMPGRFSAATTWVRVTSTPPSVAVSASSVAPVPPTATTAAWRPGVVATLRPMARDHDRQLLESVAVRRARLRETLLWGRDRRRRAGVDNLKRFGTSLIVTAVLCAGCVGFSFVEKLITSQRASTGTSTSQSTTPPRPSATGTP